MTIALNNNPNCVYASEVFFLLYILVHSCVPLTFLVITLIFIHLNTALKLPRKSRRSDAKNLMSKYRKFQLSDAPVRRTKRV
jgi:hypothetical protein